MAAKPARAAFQTMVINLLAPILGGRFEILGTPQTPAAFRCTVAANVGRGALHAPRTPLILRRVYDQTLGRDESLVPTLGGKRRNWGTPPEPPQRLVLHSVGAGLCACRSCVIPAKAGIHAPGGLCLHALSKAFIFAAQSPWHTTVEGQRKGIWGHPRTPRRDESLCALLCVEL